MSAGGLVAYTTDPNQKEKLVDTRTVKIEAQLMSWMTRLDELENVFLGFQQSVQKRSKQT
jgi:hypothetical protein